MKAKPILAVVCAALAFGGACKSRRPRVALTTPLPMQASEDRVPVWFPDVVAPYALGRYLDPRDPNVVHEAHTVYRREQTCRPNLAPPGSVVGSAWASGSASNATLFLRDALTAELNQQRATSQALMEQAQALDQQLHLLRTQNQALHQAMKEISGSRASSVTVSNRLDHSMPSSPPPSAPSSALAVPH